LRDHTYADLATAAVGSADEASLTTLIEDAAWESLLQASTTATPADHTVTFRALRCPSGGGLVVPLTLARNATEDDHLAGTVYELSGNDLAILSEHSSTAWHPYTHTWGARLGAE
jgi:hypothetical protein